jgi:hypothetical protein
MNPIKAVYEKYDDLIGWRFRRFSTSVGNLIRWFPIVWRDREWDHHYVYEILKHKLTHMAKYFRTRDMWVGQIREAERMELCVRLISKVQEEYYLTEHMDVMEKKYGKMRFNFEKVEGADEKNQTRVLNGWRYGDGDRTQEETEAIRNEYSELAKLGEIRHEKAKRILFELMKRNIGKWWD